MISRNKFILFSSEFIALSDAFSDDKFEFSRNKFILFSFEFIVLSDAFSDKTILFSSDSFDLNDVFSDKG